MVAVLIFSRFCSADDGFQFMLCQRVVIKGL